MKLSPAIKGQLTKALNQHPPSDVAFCEYPPRVHAVRAVFQKIMPREQAKHATRKYLAVRP